MLKLTTKQTQALVAAQDTAAAHFWAYPDGAWQEAFQAVWLKENTGERIAVDMRGLLWGSEDI